MNKGNRKIIMNFHNKVFMISQTVRFLIRLAVQNLIILLLIVMVMFRRVEVFRNYPFYLFILSENTSCKKQPYSKGERYDKKYDTLVNVRKKMSRFKITRKEYTFCSINAGIHRPCVYRNI